MTTSPEIRNGIACGPTTQDGSYYYLNISDYVTGAKKIVRLIAVEIILTSRPQTQESFSKSAATVVHNGVPTDDHTLLVQSSDVHLSKAVENRLYFKSALTNVHLVWITYELLGKVVKSKYIAPPL